MRHFVDIDGKIYGIDEGQEELISDDWVELTDEELAERLKPTPEQLAQIEAAQAKAERAAAMLSGAPYTLDGIEYKISFTKDDGDGLVQVKAAFELGLPSTTIHFENGTKLPITAAEFLPFAEWFVTKRNGFFV